MARQWLKRTYRSCSFVQKNFEFGCVNTDGAGASEMTAGGSSERGRAQEYHP